MERTEKFDLNFEINQLIQYININQNLGQEETDELFDHLLSESEYLMESGLSAPEAFTITKMRFGESKMIRLEFEKIKPKYPFGYIFINSIMIVSAIILLNIITGYSSILTFKLYQVSTLPTDFLTVLDLSLKFILSGGIIYWVYWSLRSNAPFARGSYYILPIIAVIYSFGFNWVSPSIFYSLRGLDMDFMSGIGINTYIIGGLIVLGLVIIYFMYLSQERKKSALVRV